LQDYHGHLLHWVKECGFTRSLSSVELSRVSGDESDGPKG